MKAKKAFGQHFLEDTMVVNTIIDVFCLNNTTNKTLEVGPGKGILTEHLLKTYPEMIAVEADRDMVAYLNESLPSLHLIEGDFLKANIVEIMKNEPFAIIGNFPYNISSQIVFKMIDNYEHIPLMVGMFQKEMAERIVAKPGSKTYGIISILAQAYYEGQLILHIKPSAFNPPPKVDSAVIILRRKTNNIIDYDTQLFKTIVKTSFNQRRKMLRNTLKPFLNEETLTDKFFERRPETLSLEDFIQLTHKIKQNES